MPPPISPLIGATTTIHYYKGKSETRMLFLNFTILIYDRNTYLYLLKYRPRGGK